MRRPRWTSGLMALAGLLAGCAHTSTVAEPRPAVATPAERPAAGGAAATDYPLGVAVFPVGHRRALPALTGTTLEGRTLAVSSLRGHVVVLAVWASWCEPCRTESPALARLAAEPAASTVRFVGLDENDDPRRAASFRRRTGASYPDLVDRGTLLARLAAWLPDAVPGCLVIDPQGRVAARVVGPVTAAQLRPVLAGLVAA